MERRKERHSDRVVLVLILIVMEDTLGDNQLIKNLTTLEVLILIVMEDILGDGKVKCKFHGSTVLILVLMEDTLGGFARM